MKSELFNGEGTGFPHCITWVYRKKRHRKYFRSRLEALRFRNEKEQEWGVPQRTGIENELLFWLLGEINDKLNRIEERLSHLEGSMIQQEESLHEIKKPPPKILRISKSVQKF